jgi:hypothetical protein
MSGVPLAVVSAWCPHKCCTIPTKVKKVPEELIMWWPMTGEGRDFVSSDANEEFPPPRPVLCVVVSQHGWSYDRFR